MPPAKRLYQRPFNVLGISERTMRRRFSILNPSSPPTKKPARAPLPPIVTVNPPTIPFDDDPPEATENCPTNDDNNDADDADNGRAMLLDTTLSSTYSENEDQRQNKVHTLYDGCRVTSNEAVRLIYAYSLRHKLSKSALGDLLTLIHHFLPEGVDVPQTKYLLEMKLLPDFTRVKRSFYCKECECNLDLADNDTEKQCPQCKTMSKKSELIKEGKYFFLFDLQTALSNVLQVPRVAQNLAENLQERRYRSKCGIYKDIVDGERYGQLHLGDHDFTCCINTDGISVFGSSKFSIWPILLSINELSYKTRRRHTVLFGLWFGKTKPPMDTFLRPLVRQCNDLLPVQWQHQGQLFSSKVVFPMFAADAPARCMVQGIKQFNGEYGCPWCLAPGRNLNMSNGTHKWIYPPTLAPRRTAELFLEHLEMLETQLSSKGKDSCYGVLNASSLLLLKDFNIVDGFVFDYMHTALLGVLRTYTNMYLDSSNHQEDYYIGDKTTVLKINRLFLKCKVPVECNRTPRDVGERKFWKANEWKTWMLVCLPILRNILPAHHLTHLAKFVLATSLLLGNEVTSEQINMAEKLFISFAKEAPNLYGLQISTFNLHILQHAADCVRNWGPLWCYSLFQFENDNGLLTRLFSGTTHVCLQIMNKLNIIGQLRALGEAQMNSPEALGFFRSLLERRTFYKQIARCNSRVTLLGPRKKYTLNTQDKTMLERAGIPEVHDAWRYKTYIVHGVKFSIEASDSNKRCNSIVEIKGQTFITKNLLLLQAGCDKTPVIWAVKVDTTPLYNNNPAILKVLRVSSKVRVFHCKDVSPIKHYAIRDQKGSILYICKLPNNLELE